MNLNDLDKKQVESSGQAGSSSILATAGVYSCSIFFNVILAFAAILIPLYGLSVGLSGVQIGILLSLPSIFQVTLRLFLGALVDQLGEKKMLYFCFTCTLIGTLLFWLWGTYMALALGQMLLGISRSIYWTSTQTYASRIPGRESRETLGRLTSFVNIGKMSGVIIAGIVAYKWGFGVAFALAVGMAIASNASVLLMPNLPCDSQRRQSGAIWRNIGQVILQRPLYLGGVAAFVGGLATALTESFYPVLLKQLGYTEGIIGFITSLRGFGAIIIGLIFAYLARRLSRLALFVISAAGTGLAFVLIPFSSSAIYLTMMMLVIGLCSAIDSIVYQTLALELSKPDQRALSLSMVGMFWGLAYMVGPVSFGWMIDTIGVAYAFFWMGVCLLGISLASGWLFKLLLPAHLDTVYRGVNA